MCAETILQQAFVVAMELTTGILYCNVAAFR